MKATKFTEKDRMLWKSVSGGLIQAEREENRSKMRSKWHPLK